MVPLMPDPEKTNAPPEYVTKLLRCKILVIERIGEMAYELQPPAGSKIHLVFPLSRGSQYQQQQKGRCLLVEFGQGNGTNA